MRRPSLGLTIAVGSAVAMVAVPVLWVRIGCGLIALGCAAPLFRCRHPGPLGLLPPVDDASGDRLPARWFCDRCGKEWPAGLERDHAPIQKFTGYDESKAVRAARRAGELEDGQRKLALRRSGVGVTVTPVARKPKATFGEQTRPVPIRGRLAG